MVVFGKIGLLLLENNWPEVLSKVFSTPVIFSSFFQNSKIPKILCKNVRYTKGIIKSLSHSVKKNWKNVFKLVVVEKNVQLSLNSGSFFNLSQISVEEQLRQTEKITKITVGHSCVMIRGQNRRLLKWDKTADFLNETKPPTLTEKNCHQNCFPDKSLLA